MPGLDQARPGHPSKQIGGQKPAVFCWQQSVGWVERKAIPINSSLRMMGFAKRSTHLREFFYDRFAALFYAWKGGTVVGDGRDALTKAACSCHAIIDQKNIEDPGRADRRIFLRHCHQDVFSGPSAAAFPRNL
jgi:hypothetical protein